MFHRYLRVSLTTTYSYEAFKKSIHDELRTCEMAFEKGLIDDGLIDSLDIVAVVTELMEAFDVELGVDDLTPENFNSVEAIEELIESRQS